MRQGNSSSGSSDSNLPSVTRSQGALKKGGLIQSLVVRWTALKRLLSKKGHNTYLVFDILSQKAIHLEGRIGIALGILMWFSIVVALAPLPTQANYALNTLFTLLKCFAPIMLTLLVGRKLFKWVFGDTSLPPPPPSPSSDEPLTVTSFRSKVANRQDIVDIAHIAHDEFGSHIRLADRLILFFAWHAAANRAMRLITREEKPEGYCICLPLEPAIARAHWRGKYSQYDIIVPDIRRRSNTIYIQGVVLRNHTEIAGTVIRETLLRMVDSLIENIEEPVTLYFEEFSPTTARWGENHYFVRLENKSCEGHPIWKLEIKNWREFKTQLRMSYRFRQSRSKRRSVRHEKSNSRRAA